LADDRDIDVFIKLPASLERKEFVDVGMEVAMAVADRGDEWGESYAEHPYVKARFGEFDVDLVPCFDVESAGDILSAVDRTPFHDIYLNDRIRGLEDEVLLLKAFMKGVGIYSAEARVRGFSGYLTELLVLMTGGFEEALEEASGWGPGVQFDPEGHGTAKEFDGPLVVVDPVDPDRNVAAALSLEKFAEFVQSSRDFSDEPGEEFFFPERGEVSSGLSERGTFVAVVEVEVEGMVADNLYPQLRKTRDALADSLGRMGFEVFRAEAFEGVVVVELLSRQLPEVELHEGPPVWVGDHVDRFLEKYGGDEVFGGPWVNDEGRVVVERQRGVTDALEALEGLVDERKGFGKTLAEDGSFEVLGGREAWDRVPDAYLSKRMPWRK